MYQETHPFFFSQTITQLLASLSHGTAYQGIVPALGRILALQVNLIFHGTAYQGIVPALGRILALQVNLIFLYGIAQWHGTSYQGIVCKLWNEVCSLEAT
jgi:hypothetical protein